jgi:hypothetical protein
MSRIGKIITDLEDLHQQDLKTSARVFAITATLATRLQQLLHDLDGENRSLPSRALPSGDLNRADLLALYGSYHNAYRAYKEAYNLKGVKGWDSLLRSIRGLKPPKPRLELEQRVAKLEQTVKALGEILLENSRSLD